MKDSPIWGEVLFFCGFKPRFVRVENYAKSSRFMPNAVIIHLVRNPESILLSNLKRIKKGTGFRFLRKNYKAKHLTLFFLTLSSINWVVGNILAEIIKLTAPSKIVTLRFEDFCSNPQKELARLERIMDVDFSSIKEKLSYNEPMTIGHNIGGNHMRMKGYFYFEPSKKDESSYLPFIYKIIVRVVTWPFMLKYGYKIL